MRYLLLILLFLICFYSPSAFSWGKYCQIPTGSCGAPSTSYASVYFVSSGGLSDVQSAILPDACPDGYSCAWVKGVGSITNDDLEFLSLQGITYTQEQCEIAYSGSRTYTDVPMAEVDGGFTSPNGACSIQAADGVAMFGEYPDGSTWVNADWVVTTTGEVAGSSGDSSGTYSEFTAPDYMTPVDECQVSCVTIDGQIYEVDQTAIDNGTISVIGGDFDGPTGDGSGDGSGGDGSGGDGGDGTGDGTGDGSGDGSGGDGDGSGDGTPGSPPGAWEPGSEEPTVFDPDGEGEQLLLEAQQRLTDTIETIRQEISAKGANVSGGGSCPSTVNLSFGGTSAPLDVCSKLDSWGGPVRSAVLLVGALLSLSILLRARD